jgi:hypothetical protein
MRVLSLSKCHLVNQIITLDLFLGTNYNKQEEGQM